MYTSPHTSLLNAHGNTGTIQLASTLHRKEVPCLLAVPGKIAKHALEDFAKRDNELITNDLTGRQNGVAYRLPDLQTSLHDVRIGVVVHR
jgi:hypothetical protein